MKPPGGLPLGGFILGTRGQLLTNSPARVLLTEMQALYLPYLEALTILLDKCMYRMVICRVSLRRNSSYSAAAARYPTVDRVSTCECHRPFVFRYLRIAFPAISASVSIPARAVRGT